MEIEMPHKRDRGQVGIGTLIVFIAMVLVAAIAAGVLINTAGFLQSQSEETGESSSEQVTNRVDVVNAVGEQIDDSAGTVDKVTVTVKQAPGAANIDIGSTIVQWTDDSGAYDLTYGADSGSNPAPNATHFGTNDIQDDDTSLTTGSPVLNDPSDRLALVFDVDDIHQDDDTSDWAGNGLSEGQSAELQINTQSGGTSNLILNVPQTLSGTSAVNL